MAGDMALKRLHLSVVHISLVLNSGEMFSDLFSSNDGIIHKKETD